MSSRNSFRRKPRSAGVDDMVMLEKSKDNDIEKNLRDRYNVQSCYTYIGEVLIAVNPFKDFGIYNDDNIEKYTGANLCDNPPHIFAVGDDMYRNLMVDKENQCVIISGESGAGKTYNAKYIMEYLSKVSGGVGDIERVKSVIMATNPLLEAFGNAKTTRNNNSSRFGKYFTIKFDYGGQPIGGDITTFLLEKTRVSGIQNGERNFHIFYQLINGLDQNSKRAFEIYDIQNYNYLTMNRGLDHCVAEGIDDREEFRDVQEALSLIGVGNDVMQNIFRMLSGILHLGNIVFEDSGAADEHAVVNDTDAVQRAATCLSVDPNELINSMCVKEFKIGNDVTEKGLNKDQAGSSRNSIAQGIYARLFDHLVKLINITLKIPQEQLLDVGVLDIYGFEIFDKNGFEQLCINFVNEKLQQIFIELTLKAEQEEYAREGIEWRNIPYKDNKVLCELIQGKRPPGVFPLMDDVCKQNHAQEAEKVDPIICSTIVRSLQGEHLSGGNGRFTIHHYAGPVNYSPDGFFDKNRNTLLRNIIVCMQNSKNALLSELFNNENDRLISHPNAGAVRGHKRPPTAGATISKQSNALVEALTKCRPHYVRCIKPNEVKRYGDWDQERVRHQIRYLGLAENIKVRRAGFAYRRTFDQFLQRYNILAYADNPHQAQNPPKYNQNPQACQNLMNKILSDYLTSDEFQYGKTKVFVKSPESVNLLEEQRERVYDEFARIIQKHLKNYVNKSKVAAIKESANAVVFAKKERNRASIKRRFYSDYLGCDSNPMFRQFMGKKERIIFASKCVRYTGKMNEIQAYLVVSNIKLQVLGWEVKDPKIKNPVYPADYEFVVKFEISFSDNPDLTVSELIDGFLLIKDPEAQNPDPKAKNGDCLLRIRFLTEFLYCLATKTRNPPFIKYHPRGQNLIFELKPKTGFMSKVFAKKNAHERYLVFDYSSNHGRTGLNGGVEIVKNSPKKNFHLILVPQGQDKNVVIEVERPKEIIPSGNSYGATGFQNDSNMFQDNNRNKPIGQVYNNTNNNSGNIFLSPSTTQNSVRNFYRGNRVSQKASAASAMLQSMGKRTGPVTSSGISLGASIRQQSTIATNSSPNQTVKANNYQQTNQQQHSYNPSQPSGQAFRLPGIAAGNGPPKVNHVVTAQTTTQSINQSGSTDFHQSLQQSLAQNVAQQSTIAVNRTIVQPNKPLPKPKPAPKPRQNINKCKALYTYEAQDIDELTIQEGDIIVVSKKVENGWWDGTNERTRKSGSFPGNYVQMI